MVKKSFNAGFIFIILGIFAGAFYREFTLFLGFTGQTSMSIMHTHLLTTGGFMFFIFALCFKAFNVAPSKKLNILLPAYLVSVVGNVAVMFVRGLFEVMGWEITKAINGTLSGIAGLDHILLTITLIWIFNIIRKAVPRDTVTA